MPSLIVELEKLNEGACICSARPVSIWPLLRRRSPRTSSTGTLDSSGRTPAERVPTLAWTSTISLTTSNCRRMVTVPSESATSRRAGANSGAVTTTE